ncbi:mannose-6-phosphate isomerase [Swingsia samuiensis]|uniref:Mannose-6-phosphate isomerase n=1 Tax=Swingsia samuiensis TaxID=1293412 RepID=A0A4Y6UMN8_9PROT|nr:mannose-6-phosphate isomerase [Swingsia samuiensis]
MGKEWNNWTSTQALPLWANQGFDSKRFLYYERLNWDGSAVNVEHLRLMVQARQVVTYCRAALDNIYDASENAVRCIDVLERLYYQRDGLPGWIFALAPDGTPSNTTRDLYAHAFILLAYAWAYRLTGNNHYKQTARQTAGEVQHIFGASNKGFHDMAPAQSTIRSQNPHMHLLEAYLALFEVTSEPFYLDQAEKLVELALEHFICKKSDMLLEFFKSDWSSQEEWGENRVEPGHLFEWSWLLEEYRRLTNQNASNDDRIHDAAEKLFLRGYQKGTDKKTGIVFDAMTERGVISERSTRIWPQTELMRLLCQRYNAGSSTQNIDFLQLASKSFFQCYIPEKLSGGWVDRLDQASQPLVDYMPASSLYHIYGAARELIL